MERKYVHQPIFPKKEYVQRWDGAKELMEANNLDAYLLTEETNHIYYTGHESWIMGRNGKHRPHITIIPRDGDPVMIVHGNQYANALKSTWVSDVRSRSSKEKPMMPYDIDFMLTDILKELKLSKGKIGCELGYEQRIQIPYNEFMKLQKRFPDAEFVDAGDLFWKQRLIKSSAEIKYLRKTCEITGRAYEKTFNLLESGMTEAMIAQIWRRVIIDEGCEQFWGPIIDYKDGYHRTNYRYQKGDVLRIDGGGVYHGYQCDFNRCAVFGDPTVEQEKIMSDCFKVTDGMMDVIKPGVKLSELIDASIKWMKKLGYGDLLKKSPRAGRDRWGHGQGIGYEPPSIGDWEKFDTLEAGWFLCLEPMGYIKADERIHDTHESYQGEENIVVTEDGYDFLTKTAKRELHIIPT